VYLLGASCPSEGLCVAVGTNNLIASSTDPSQPLSWHYGYAGEGPWPKTNEWPTENISGRQIQAVSCPSAGLCVAVTDQGFIYSSTDPAGPAAAWKSVQIDDGMGNNTHLFGVSCPTTGLCVAVSGKRTDQGKIFTTTEPTGPASAWTSIELGESFEFRAVSCASASLCVAVANDGRIVVSTDPRGGSAAWKVLAAPGGGGSLRSVACLSAPLCLTGNEGGNLLSSTNPIAGPASWKEVPGGGSVQITGVACPTSSACVAVDNNGDAITSTHPTGEASSWSFENVQPFTGEEGNALFAVSCPSTALCTLVGSRGRILTGRDPFAAETHAQAHPSRHRGKRAKRPRVKVARIELPFRQQLERHRGRVTIRFYAHGRPRGYLCRLDHHRFRRCRSPKRYPIGIGHHVFRVRAIGYTGLRGPITIERFTVDPLCESRSPRSAVLRSESGASAPLSRTCY